jgi:hypothetical protein
LTRGNPLGFANFLNQLNPTFGTYTAVFTSEDQLIPLIGQIRYPLGSQAARVAYLLPVDSGNLIALSALMEHLAAQAGEWGAFHLIGEVDEETLVFEALKRAGFSIYNWQRIWQITAGVENLKHPPGKDNGLTWSLSTDMDSIAVKSLYQAVVPALVQPVEPLLGARLHGLVYREEGEVIAYADIAYGPAGIWVQPIIHPATHLVTELLLGLSNSLPHRGNRPVYLCVRSYQAWIESALDHLNAEVGPRQALMVKHMAISQKVTHTIPLPALEKSRVEPARSQPAGFNPGPSKAGLGPLTK